MATGRSGSDGNASAKPFSRQDVENDLQRRSRSKASSTYPSGYACGAFFSAALLAAILNILRFIDTTG
jgi:hypothetical protein